MKIKCDLANDATGKDLSEFRKALVDCDLLSGYDVLDTDISTLEFITKRCEIKRWI